MGVFRERTKRHKIVRFSLICTTPLWESAVRICSVGNPMLAFSFSCVRRWWDLMMKRNCSDAVHLSEGNICDFDELVLMRCSCRKAST